jgi:hypothetical protein
MAHPTLGLSWHTAAAASRRSAAQPNGQLQEQRSASMKEGKPGPPQVLQHLEPKHCASHIACAEPDVVACAGCCRHGPPPRRAEDDDSRCEEVTYEELFDNMDLVSCHHAPRRRKRQYMISAYILQIMDKLAK